MAFPSPLSLFLGVFFIGLVFAGVTWSAPDCVAAHSWVAFRPDTIWPGLTRWLDAIASLPRSILKRMSVRLVSVTSISRSYVPTRTGV